MCFYYYHFFGEIKMYSIYTNHEHIQVVKHVFGCYK